jgi:hypothetical protein
MNPNTQFTSKLNTFRATEIDSNIIGCDGIYQVFHLNTNICVGKIYGDTGEISFNNAGEPINWKELKELAELTNSIQLALEY